MIDHLVYRGMNNKSWLLDNLQRANNEFFLISCIGHEPQNSNLVLFLIYVNLYIFRNEWDFHPSFYKYRSFSNLHTKRNNKTIYNILFSNIFQYPLVVIILIWHIQVVCTRFIIAMHCIIACGVIFMEDLIP